VFSSTHGILSGDIGCKYTKKREKKGIKRNFILFSSQIVQIKYSFYRQGFQKVAPFFSFTRKRDNFAHSKYKN
jgi:hypothetical protein